MKTENKTQPHPCGSGFFKSKNKNLLIIDHFITIENSNQFEPFKINIRQTRFLFSKEAIFASGLVAFTLSALGEMAQGWFFCSFYLLHFINSFITATFLHHTKD